MSKKQYGPNGSRIQKPDLSQYRPLESNELMQVGDVVHRRNSMFDEWYEITRVTKTTAFIMYNDTSIGKLPISSLNPDHIRTKGCDKWNTTYHKPYRKK